MPSQSPAANSQVEGIQSTGISGLDAILNGGFPAGHFYLIEGAPGAGKTTLALQFLREGIRQKESVLYITLSESHSELEGVIRSHGWNFAPPVLDMATVDEDVSAEAQYTVFHPSEIELADTISSLIAKVEEVKPTRCVIDSVAELRMLARDGLRFRRQILALKRFFTGVGCTVLLLDDRSGEGVDLQLQSIAHGVLLLENLPRDYGVKRRRIEVRKLRGSSFKEGFHDFVIQRGGLRVFERLVAADHRPDWQKHMVKSGVDALDDLLSGGLDAGTTTLLMGPAGAGKSTITAQYALQAALSGGRAAIYAFDESRQVFLTRCAGLGMDLGPHIASNSIMHQQIDAAELSPGEFTHRVRRAVFEDNVRVVILDSLNGLMTSMPNEKQLTMQLHELAIFLNQMGVATFITMAQSGMLGSNMQSPVDVSYLADTVILLRFFEAFGEVRKAISVVKKRSGPHENTIRELSFRDSRLSVGEPLSHFEGVLSGIPAYRGTAAELE